MNHSLESNSFRPKPYATSSLIALNVILFLYELTLNGRSLAVFIDRWALVPVQFVTNFSDNINYVELATPFTSLLLHGGWTHLLGNMLFLWVFGDLCEMVLGSVRLVALYFACGLFASLAQFAIEPFSPVAIVGASGAVAGLLGAHIALAQQAQTKAKHRQPNEIRLFFFPSNPLPVILVIAFWFTWQFFNGVAQIGSVQTQNGGVAFFAHIGGFVAGIMLVRLFGRSGN